MTISRILGKRGRTTIPDDLRRRLGWQAGDTIRFRLDGDRVIISRDKPPAQAKAEPPELMKLLLALLIGGAPDG